jgi:hypothetical protein
LASGLAVERAARRQFRLVYVTARLTKVVTQYGAAF